MRNIVIFAAVLLALSGVSAFAQSSDTADLNLIGTITEVIEIQVSGANTYDSSFNFVTAGETDLNVGTLEWRTNMIGYGIAVTSSNGFNLLRDTGTETVPYTVSIGTDDTGQNADFSLTNLPAPLGDTLNTREILISYGSVAAQPAGTYLDTLTFEISAP